MKILKKCSCGKEYTTIPEGAVVNEVGVWWKCECKTCLLIMSPSIKEKIENMEDEDNFVFL